MKKISIILTIIILMLAFSSVTLADEPASDEWMKAMFLAEDSRDMIRLTNYAIKYWPNYDYPDISGFLERLDAQINMSKVYITAHLSPKSLIDEYKKTGKINIELIDGIPAERRISVPVYSQDKMAGIVDVRDWLPHEDQPPIIPPDSGGLGFFLEVDSEDDLHEVDEEPISWTYAEEGYALLQAMDIEPRNIIAVSIGTDKNKCLFITEAEDFYVYPIIIKGEETQGYQITTLENYIKALANNAKPTPTPMPTPTPERTSFQPTVTPRPSATEGIVRPTVPVKSDNPSGNAGISPTASPAAPETKKTGLTWIAPIAVLCCAAAGGIVWAAVTAKKKKD